jgi:hypothetical protein
MHLNAGQDHLGFKNGPNRMYLSPVKWVNLVIAPLALAMSQGRTYPKSLAC